MDAMKRESPVQFRSRPLETKVRDLWPVVLEYEQEGAGPWLADLSHKTRWDFQDGRLDEHLVGGVRVPAVPGDCCLDNRILINRLNRTQAAIWHLGDQAPPPLPEQIGYTDVTEANMCLALFGPYIFTITEKLSALDFESPERQTPFLLQGPFSQVPSQIVILTRAPERGGALLLACSRGYASDMVAAVLAAGAAHGLRPAGEKRFTNWLAGLPL
jgi:hypothetical protein